MSNQQKQRIQIPDSLRDILLEFSIAYLLEQPGDVVDYAVEFFTKLQENRKSKISHDDAPASPDESELMSLDEGKSYFFVFYYILRIKYTLYCTESLSVHACCTCSINFSICAIRFCCFLFFVCMLQ